MELATGASVGWALLLAVVLAGLHLAAPRIRRLPFVSAGAIGSFVSGLSVAYVFLHLLPGVAAGNASIGSTLSRVV